MSETSLDKRPEALSKNDLNTAGADKRSKAQSHPVPQIPSMCPLLVVILAMGTLNFIIHLVVLPQMPDMLPTHWGIDGTTDDYTSKYEELWLCPVPFLSVLMLFVPRFDPKGEAYTKVWRFFQVLLLVLTLFFCAMTWLPELSVIGIIPQDDNLMGAVILLMVGLLLIFVGNYIPRVRQNYSMGIKTPWALADEYTWQRSQRMGGICFVAMGVVYMLTGAISLFIPALRGSDIPFIILMVVLFAGILWMYVYSYLVYRGIMR